MKLTRLTINRCKCKDVTYYLDDTDGLAYDVAESAKQVIHHNQNPILWIEISYAYKCTDEMLVSLLNGDDFERLPNYFQASLWKSQAYLNGRF